jgi:hypothetical protein
MKETLKHHSQLKNQFLSIFQDGEIEPILFILLFMTDS